MIPLEEFERVLSETLPTVVQTRRRIHQHPELAHLEYVTTDLIAAELRKADLSPRVRTPKTGLSVELGSGERTIAFRSDIDALPIDEPAGLPFASQTKDVMHACGHDAHAAIGLGVAIAASRLDLPGRLRVLFQPAEESFPGGAYELVRENLLDGVESIFAFHVDPALEAGRVGFKTGAITSSADRFFITLEGPGGHTARPHKTVDLIGAAGHLISHLPAMLKSRIDVRAPLVMVFGRVNGGTADNVIPTTVELSGTIRTADRNAWDEIPSHVDKLVSELTAPFAARSTVHYQRGLAPVMNDPGVTATLRASTAGVLGPSNVVETFVSMGAEDFSRYLDEVPGTLMRLGCAESDTSTDLHSATFRLDERSLEVGLRVALRGILALLETGTQSTS